MELFDIYGDKYNITLDNTINEYYQKIRDFAESPELYNDNDLLKILTLNYYNYGVYCNSLVTNNNELKFSNKLFFKSLDLINDFGTLIVYCPKKFLKEINFYINNIDKLLCFIEDKHEEILEYDNKILLILRDLRNSNYFDYLKNLIDLNNIRIMINRIFFEYAQDINYLSNRFKQIKYDFFITENNIKSLILKFNSLKEKADKILQEELLLFFDNNKDRFNIKEIYGSIKYDEFIKIIEKRIENI